MRFVRLSLPLATVMILAASTMVGHADTYLFSFSGPSTDSFSFSLPSSPTNVQLNGPPALVDFFDVPNVSVDLNGTLATRTVRFSEPANGGGIIFVGAPGFGYDFGGVQLFTGSPATPTFVLGTFTLDETPSVNTVPNGKSGIGTLIITDITDTPSPTPEPSTFVLLGTGILGFAGVARRKLFHS